MDHTQRTHRPRPARQGSRIDGGTQPDIEPHRPFGLVHWSGFFGPALQRELLADVEAIIAHSPLYRPAMPRSGKPLSVHMTNAGPLGWVADKDGGYRYQAHHPITGQPWPGIPPVLLELWAEVAGHAAMPQACLINVYEKGSRLGSHVDADEADTAAPVVSVSLGADAVFHIGGPARSDPKSRLVLRSGDVVVLGGAARRCYHGIDRILPTSVSLLPAGRRINLTLRRVTLTC